MKISIGADHRGYSLKNALIKHFAKLEWADVGAFDKKRSDYPVFAQKVCQSILKKKAKRGILICGSGVGMVIAANRYPKIYATLCWNSEIARVARQDDGSNVLVLPSDFITKSQAIAIVEAWLAAPFKGGHYQERLDMVDE